MPDVIPGNFEANTRRLIVKTALMSPASFGGATTQIQLPRSGLLSSIRLLISVTVGGTVNAANALGAASAIKRVRVTLNNGTDVFNMSGAGYHYLLRQYINDYHDPVPQSTARSAVSATTFNLDMLIPIALSNRDLIGLINLQNEQTQANLSIDWENQTVVGGSTATITAATAQPFVELFTVPVDKKDYPPLTLLHQIVEEQIIVSGAGDVTYNLPRGNTYLQMLFGAGIAQAGSDAWSAALLRMQQTYFLYNGATPGYFNSEYAESHAALGNTASPAARIAGVVPFDFMGTSGLGVYGKYRDSIDSSQLTDLAAVITATGATTLFAVRRQLVVMRAG